MDNYHFGFPILLTAYHFLMTFGLLEILCRLNVIERATNVPMKVRWILGALSVGGVLFMNINLKVNSVGFYQLSKLCCIPFLVVYDYFKEGKKTPLKMLLTLGILLIGVALFSVNDVEFRFYGAIIACIAVALVSLSQKQMGGLQHVYNVSGGALQHSSAFQQFIIALVCGCVLEMPGKDSILEHEFCLKEVLMIIGTGFISVSVNVCGFGLLGKTGPITYQVVGHAKSILIFIFGQICVPPKDEQKEQVIKKFIGLAIAMFGMILYTVLKLKKDQEGQPKTVIQQEEEDKLAISDVEEEEEAQSDAKPEEEV